MHVDKVLLIDCTPTVLILYSYCTHTVLMHVDKVLYSYCTHTVLILYSYCTHAVLILYSYCTNNARRQGQRRPVVYRGSGRFRRGQGESTARSQIHAVLFSKSDSCTLHTHTPYTHTHHALIHTIALGSSAAVSSAAGCGEGADSNGAGGTVSDYGWVSEVMRITTADGRVK
jgi:hypothetical protein